MAAWRFEISLLVLKIFHERAALTREIIYTSCHIPRETVSFVFPRALMKHQDSRENKTN